MKILAIQILVLLALLWTHKSTNYVELYNKGRIWEETERSIYALTSMEMDIQRHGLKSDDAEMVASNTNKLKKYLASLEGRQHEVSYTKYLTFYNEVQSRMSNTQALLRSKEDECQWKLLMDSSYRVRGDVDMYVVRDDTMNNSYSWSFRDGTRISGKRVTLSRNKFDLLSAIEITKRTKFGETMNFKRSIK